MLIRLYGERHDEFLGTKVISFNREVKKILLKGHVDRTKLAIRSLSLILCLTCFVTSLLGNPFINLFIYFTNWTLWVTTLFIACSIWCSLDIET